MSQHQAFQIWSQLSQAPQIVEFFSGLFERVGVVITDTGEELTAEHTGNAVTFSPGLNRAQVDYVVNITSLQVARLATEVPSGQLSPLEQHRVIRALFTPATAAILANPVFGRPWLRRVSGAETVIHVILDPFEGEEGTTHTLEWNGQGWKVTPGLHGHANRTYHLNYNDAVAFQKRAFTLSHAPTLLNVIRFALWYRSWRKEYSIRKINE